MMLLPFKWCPHCGCIISAGGFCRDCKAMLLQDQSSTALTHSQSISLYRYQGILRSVILRAKVNNENASLAALCDLFSGHPKVIEIALASDVIVPAPSSFWGRLRGRYDLAQSMALSLGRAVDRPVEFFPFEFYFRRKKRAGSNKQFSHIETIDAGVKQSITKWQNKSLLIVDDIMTTGVTLEMLRSALQPQSAQVATVTLASAQSIVKAKGS